MNYMDRAVSRVEREVFGDQEQRRPKEQWTIEELQEDTRIAREKAELAGWGGLFGGFIFPLGVRKYLRR